MGNQLAGIAPSQIFPVEHYLTDLPDFSYDTNLGSTRFFKVARAKNKEGLTVVKVFVIHDPSLPLKAHRDRVEEIRRLLATGSNCLPFQGTILTEKSGILVRQFVKDNLYDRISTRPFLNSIEKRWIAFQLLNCLNHCHKLGVCHGDIKLENIMVTSWNWVFLTDFASFKPTYLPEDNPADFSYFFDTSRRRTCYIAPERFVKTLNSEAVHNSTVTSLVLPDDEIKKGDLTPAMDIFSMGCALTELFTEGHAPFDFSQLLAYRSGEYSPWKVLEKIDDLCIRELVRSMMQKDPSKRSDAGEYLNQMRNKAFPEYFYTFLEGYVKGFASVPILTPDEKVERLRNDIDIITKAVTEKEKADDTISSTCLESGFSEGLVIMVPLLTSCLRSLKHCTAKLHALEVLKKMAMYLSPDIILDRLLPYMVFLAKDKYPRVCVAIIQTLTACLTMVKNIPRSDSNIFPEYILPNLAHIAQDEAVIVRMAYAGNIDVLAETALRFLEMTQLDTEPDADSCSSTDLQRHHHQQVSYDMELQALQELIQQSVTTLLSDPVNAVKQTLLEEGINRLCVFFGRQKGNDVLLSHMITFLNDKEDRHLRGAFFDGIVGVAAYVGWQCCPILKPLLQQGLADAEEFVIAKALHAMSDLTELGLIQKQMLYDLVAEAIPLLCHPNLWIKQGAVGFVCAVARCLNLADVQCKLIPLLQPFLKQPIIQVELEFALLSNVQDPLPRCLFDYLIRLPTLPTLLENLRERKVLRSIARVGHQPAYREMDNHMKTVFRRLQSDGMTEAVEDKILAMKDHLLKMHKNKACVPDCHNSSKEEGVIDLSTLPSHVPLHSVLLTGIDHPYEGQLKVGQRKLGKKKGASVESPNVTMVYRSTHAYGFVRHQKKNEEWLHMFGSAETKSPSSPKLQHHSSDPLPPYNKTAQTGKDIISAESSVPDPSGTSLSSDGKNSPSIHSASEVRLKTNNCVPCQEELHSLIRKKQEEWTYDEIVREASEIGIKEDKLLPHKWRPYGSLVAHLHEHRRAVNRIQVIPDTSLFATCSSDGTVKIWDCGRMEGRNVANRSRQTYSRLEGPVSSLTMCQNMQSLAAASDNGNIHVFRIAQDSPKYSLLHTRALDPSEEGCAVDMSYFDTGSQSVLAYATIYGSIVGWDLRSPGTAWKLESNPRLGLVTSFCVDPHHCWLVLGTATGNMICWDLRFQLPITTVSHPTGTRIRHLLLHPREQSGVFAAVQGHNEVSLWDMETQARVTTLWACTSPPLSQTQVSDATVYSMYVCSGENGSYLLTGGSDMKIRYWDLNCATDSFIVAGPANETSNTGVVSYRSRLVDGTEVIQELQGRPRTNNPSEDPPRRYPEVPHSGHHDCISGVALMQTTQCFILSASRDGVVKVWK